MTLFSVTSNDPLQFRQHGTLWLQPYFFSEHAFFPSYMESFVSLQAALTLALFLSLPVNPSNIVSMSP